MTRAQGFAMCEADFLYHYQQHCAEHGSSYEQYRPVYRYGYDLGIHKRYSDATWGQIEAEVHALWERRNPGTWEQFKALIHYAWETASGKSNT